MALGVYRSNYISNPFIKFTLDPIHSIFKTRCEAKATSLYRKENPQIWLVAYLS